MGELRDLMYEAEKPTGADLKVCLLSLLKVNAEQWNKTLKRVSGAVDRYVVVVVYVCVLTSLWLGVFFVCVCRLVCVGCTGVC